MFRLVENSHNKSKNLLQTLKFLYNLHQPPIPHSSLPLIIINYQHPAFVHVANIAKNAVFSFPLLQAYPSFEDPSQVLVSPQSLSRQLQRSPNYI